MLQVFKNKSKIWKKMGGGCCMLLFTILISQFFIVSNAHAYNEFPIFKKDASLIKFTYQLILKDLREELREESGFKGIRYPRYYKKTVQPNHKEVDNEHI